MIISINQPAYLPWLGYFDRIVHSDVHVVLDHVQFEKNSMVNRNKIRTAQGWTYLTVPVLTKGQFGNLAIDKLAIDNSQPWAKKHFKSLHGSYSRAPFFTAYESFFAATYQREWHTLNPLMTEITSHLLSSLGIKTRIVRSSELGVGGTKSELVLNICRELGAKTYISGPFGRDYLQRADFEQAGINLRFHDYHHPQYQQIHGAFEPYMSVIDLLFNFGPTSLEILTDRSSLVET